MKKLAFILALLTAAAIFAAIPASAAPTDVLKGTPVLDGKIDDIYKLSATYTIDTTAKVYNSGAEYTDCPELKATTYMLYDDKNVYIACEVTDATILSAGADKVKAGYVWQNDVTEFWISLDKGTTWGQFNMDAFGHGIGVGVPAAPFADAAGCKGAATKGTGSYVTEVSFPHGGLKAGAEFCQQTQVNNILVADASKIVCIGAQKVADRVFKLSATEAFIPKPETTTAAAAADAAPAKAAQTFDSAIIALIPAALSAAALVVIRKRK